MNLQLLPDLMAMIVLIVILLVVRKRHPQNRVHLWLVGLLFILLESIARVYYSSNGPYHRSLHALALDAYLVAGAVFIWTGYREGKDAPKRYFYVVQNTIAPLLVFTAYGLELRSVTLFHWLIIVGFAVGAVTSLVKANSTPLVAFHAVFWLPMWFFASQGMFRNVTYWALFCIYTFAAYAFYRSLPSRSTGKLAIVTGLVLWALSFLVHPWIARYPAYVQIASDTWSLQKFLITIGMVLVMLEEQIVRSEWLACHDELTGLPNRRLFEERLSEAFAHPSASHNLIALLMIDLNNFKQTNDSFGHQAGDELLRQFGANLSGHLRDTDTIARLGGDEFTILIRGLSDLSQLQRIRSAVDEAFDTPVIIAGHEIKISGAVGVAVYPNDATDAGHLYRLADRRMYDQKERQRIIEPQIVSSTIKHINPNIANTINPTINPSHAL